MIAGIDPGLSGAVCFLDRDDPTTCQVHDLPVHVLLRGGKRKRELDIAALAAILTATPLEHAFIEAVGAMPGQGISSTFAFGKGYGILLGILAASNIAVTTVPPARWKRSMGVTKSKDGCRARASQLLPRSAYEWRLKSNAGRAEAALLAIYGSQQFSGVSSIMTTPSSTTTENAVTAR
jgi:crossover junction endodeoxyribonuclease RuvC